VTESAARQARRGPSPIVAIALALAVGVLVLLAGLYLARRQLAREAVTGWLKSRGVVSESQFQELGPGRLVGRVRIGPAQSPDLVVERAEVSYSLGGLLAGRGVQVTSIRLEGATLRARWQGGRFSAGALDPLIADFRKRPPKPGAPSPSIEIDRGRIWLATDYGNLSGQADARIDKARLVRLDATVAPSQLKGDGVEAALGPVGLRVRVAGDRLTARMQAPFASLRAGQGQLSDGLLTLDLDAAYPDPARPVAAMGQATVELRAGRAQGPGAATGPIAVTARAAGLQWTRTGGDPAWVGLTPSTLGRGAAEAGLSPKPSPATKAAAASLTRR